MKFGGTLYDMIKYNVNFVIMMSDTLVMILTMFKALMKMHVRWEYCESEH